MSHAVDISPFDASGMACLSWNMDIRAPVNEFPFSLIKYGLPIPRISYKYTLGERLALCKRTAPVQSREGFVVLMAMLGWNSKTYNNPILMLFIFSLRVYVLEPLNL